MSESSDQGEKVHDPTPQKLEDARKKGDIPRSMDVSAASAMIGLLIALSFSGAEISQSTGAALAAVVERAHKLTGVILAPGGMELAMNWVQAAITPMLPIFLLPFGLAIASLVAQRAFAVSFDKIIPKFSRLGMISNAKQKFGPSGLVQFLKSTVKMVTIATVLIFYLMSKNDELIGSVHGNKHSVFALLGETLITITMASCVIFSLIGLIDLLWQRFDHARKLRMSFQDLKEEQKSAEGDPHTKAQRRQRGQHFTERWKSARKSNPNTIAPLLLRSILQRRSERKQNKGTALDKTDLDRLTTITALIHEQSTARLKAAQGALETARKQRAETLQRRGAAVAEHKDASLMLAAHSKWGNSVEAVLPVLDRKIELLENQVSELMVDVRKSYTKVRGLEALSEECDLAERNSTNKQEELSQGFLVSLRPSSQN